MATYFVIGCNPGKTLIAVNCRFKDFREEEREVESCKKAVSVKLSQPHALKSLSFGHFLDTK